MQSFFHLPERQQGLLAIAAGAILWSTAGLFIKLLPQDAFSINFYRSTLAAGLFLALFGKQLFRMNARAWLNSAFYCIVLVSFVSATKMTTAANAILLQYTAPVYVLLAEPLLFKLKLERVNVLTIFACLAGMVILVSGDLGGGNWTGNLLALCSGLMLAALLVGQRLNAPEYQLRSIFWGNIWVALVGLPAFLQAAPPTLSEAAMLGFLGIFQIGVAYLFFTYGLKRVLAIESALLAMLEPILNPVWVLIGHGEKPSTGALLGGGVILLALVVRMWWVERRKSALH